MCFMHYAKTGLPRFRKNGPLNVSQFNSCFLINKTFAVGLKKN